MLNRSTIVPCVFYIVGQGGFNYFAAVLFSFRPHTHTHTHIPGAHQALFTLYPSEMDTLEELCQHAKKELGFRPIVAMDDAFFRYLHNRVPQQHNDVAAEGAEMPQLLFHDLLGHWTRVATAVRPPPAQVCRVPMQMAKAVVVNGQDPGFPGPLCCPLTKANALSLVAQDADNYWVTEKSDGVRVVFVSILAAQFPRWRLVLRGGAVEGDGQGAPIPDAAPRLVDLCLADMITLESGFTELRMHSLMQESTQLRLTMGTHVLRRTDRPDLFSLVLRTSDVTAPEQSALVLRLLTPRHFSYVFDRSMTNSFLLMEEYPLTQLSSVILDTELVLAVHSSTAADRRRRMFLAAFDMYAYEIAAKNPCEMWSLQRDKRGGANNSNGDSSNGVGALERFVSSSNLRLLQRDSMSSRLNSMRQHVFEPLARVFQSPLTPFLPLTMVPIVMKRMVRVADMGSFFPFFEKIPVVAKKSHAPHHQAFIYEYREYPIGVTQNDGFIFTPDRFDLISGSQPNQLKWKWPDKLTVDWLIKTARSNRPAAATAVAASNMNSVAPPVGLFDVSLYFKKKRQEGQAADAGHTQFSRAMVMDNPNGVVVRAQHGSGAASDDGIVVESLFDAHRGRWIIEKSRHDKTEANSVVTVVSVLESIAEHLELGSLCAILGVDGPPLESSLSCCPRLIPADGVGSQRTDRCEEEHDAVKRQENADSTTTPIEAGEHAPSIQQSQEDGASTATTTTASSSSMPTVKPCKLVIRASQQKFSNDVTLLLQWSVKLATVRNVITCNHRKIEECFGLGEPCPELDGTSRLKDLVMIALGNGGGSYAWSNMVCDAFFDGETGRWGIVKLYQGMSSNDAFNTQVLEHLMSVAAYRARSGNFPPFPEGLNRPRERLHVVGTAASEGDSTEEQSGLPMMGNALWMGAQQVETNRHYADRAVHLSHGKQQRSVLRRMNNFIKSILLNTGVTLARTTLGGGGAGGEQRPIQVLDLCCGRGGDLQKWKNLQPVSLLVLVDSCFEAVAEAAARYSVGAGLSTKIVSGRPGFPGIPAKFYVRDCFERSGMHNLLRSVAATTEKLSLPQAQFDIVSCQFSMHYGFSDETRVRAFLSNVSDALISGGGVFVGTTVDDRRLASLRKMHGDRFGNSVYQVDFSVGAATVKEQSGNSSDGGDDRQQQSNGLYGDAYSISVEHSVESQTEYVVHWKNFVQLAQSDYDLSLVETNNFLEAFDLFVGTPIGQRVLGSVVKESGGEKQRADGMEDGEHNSGSGLRRLSSGELTLSLDDDEREAVSLFRMFVFMKN